MLQLGSMAGIDNEEARTAPYEVRCRAVLFDCDGVLVDSSAAIKRVVQTWCREQHLDEQWVLSYSHGRRAEETVRGVAPHLDPDDAVQRLTTLEEHDLDDVHALTGTSDLLNALPTDRWGVVTSGAARVCRARLAAAELPTPAVLIGAEEVAEGKPSPQGYVAAASRLGLTPADCVVIEDSPAGAQAGRTAGAFVLGVGSATLDHADITLTNLDHVLIHHDHPVPLRLTLR